jgi:hypothetical protein
MDHLTWRPIEEYSNLICGVIMVGLAVVVLIRIHKRKNN